MSTPAAGTEPSAEDLGRAVALVRARAGSTATAAIILGSGLGGLADRIDDSICIPYADIPGLAASSAQGHRGHLILGKLESKRVIVMAGRLHRYEGWSNDQIAFPVRLMAALGASSLIVSNAAGGVNPKLRVGDILVIRDHINLIGGLFSWNRGLSAAGPLRSGRLYDPTFSQAAMRVAVEQSFNAYQGTYLATLGPTFETRSEYRMMRRIGADVAGMSTAGEVLAAAHVKMRTLGLSVVSNVANPDRPVRADHTDVLEAGRAAEARMEAIVRRVLRLV